MGEGGAVNIVRDQKLKVIAESFETRVVIVGVQVVLIIPAKSLLALVSSLSVTIISTLQSPWL